MGKTISEKILAKAAGRAEVSPGEYLQIAPKRPVTLGWQMARGPGQFNRLGVDKVYDPRLINIVCGHYGVTASNGMMEARSDLHEWAAKMKIPKSNIYDLGRQGIEHVLSGELCWALPGEVFVEVINGHTSALGGLGAFAFTLSYESGAFLATGKTWIQVPGSVDFRITGKLPKGVFARDIFEYALARVGGAGAPGQVMEWTGPVIDQMGMDGRFTLCAGALFTGAWTGVVNPDKTTLDFVKSHTKEAFTPLSSDPDATFANRYEFDVSKLEPQVVPPPKRDTAKAVEAFASKPINRGFVGTCFNSRMDDMRVAAAMLKGRKVHPDVVLNITPGTMGIYKQCLKEGIMDIFAEAEVVVPPPACGMCCASNTPLGPGDVCLSTGTCNYAGRMGSREADIYLGSPATVVASCIEGKITDPRKFL